MKIFALYKGNNYIDQGTLSYLNLKWGLSMAMLYCYKTPSRKLKAERALDKNSKSTMWYLTELIFDEDENEEECCLC